MVVWTVYTEPSRALSREGGMVVWTVNTEPSTIRGRRDGSVDGKHRAEHYQGKEGW